MPGSPNEMVDPNRQVESTLQIYRDRSLSPDSRQREIDTVRRSNRHQNTELARRRDVPRSPVAQNRSNDDARNGGMEIPRQDEPVLPHSMQEIGEPQEREGMEIPRPDEPVLPPLMQGIGRLREHEDMIPEEGNQNVQRRILVDIQNLNQNINVVFNIIHIPTKPQYFPIRTNEELQNLQNLTQRQQLEAEAYFRHLGGNNVREACNYCIKDSITDELLEEYTYFGVCDNNNTVIKKPFNNTMLSTLINRSMTLRKEFPIPSVPNFQDAIMNAIRLAHQRRRTLRNRQVPRNMRNGRRIMRNVNPNLNNIE